MGVGLTSITPNEPTEVRKPMDTEFFRQALAAYVKAHRIDAKMPLCAEVLSQILMDAQALKDKARKEQNEPTTAA